MAQPTKRYDFADDDHKICCWRSCQAAVVDDADAPLCEVHLRRAWAAQEIRMAQGSDTFRAPEPDHASPRNKDAVGWVYFARVGDLIKIGWTSNVPNRMRLGNLDADALYVAVPNRTRRDERALHEKFSAHLARGREWFNPAPELMEFIKAVQTGRIAA